MRSVSLYILSIVEILRRGFVDPLALQFGSYR